MELYISQAQVNVGTGQNEKCSRDASYVQGAVKVLWK